MVFVILLFLISSFVCMGQAPEQSPINKITALRQKQITASYNEYHLCEKEIAAIKCEHGNHQRFRLEKWKHTVTGLAHLLPLIVWQLIALVAAACLVLLRGRSFVLFLIFIISCSMVWWLYQERTGHWLVLAEDAVPLYLGPCETYPIHAQLSYLEEVCLKGKKDEWLCVQSGKTLGWMRNG